MDVAKSVKRSASTGAFLQWRTSVANSDALPASACAIEFGNAFVTAEDFLGMIVPTVVMPEAKNIILNPNHPAFANVEMTIVRPFEFDSRLLG